MVEPRPYLPHTTVVLLEGKSSLPPHHVCHQPGSHLLPLVVSETSEEEQPRLLSPCLPLHSELTGSTSGARCRRCGAAPQVLLLCLHADLGSRSPTGHVPSSAVGTSNRRSVRGQTTCTSGSARRQQGPAPRSCDESSDTAGSPHGAQGRQQRGKMGKTPSQPHSAHPSLSAPASSLLQLSRST